MSLFFEAAVLVMLQALRFSSLQTSLRSSIGDAAGPWQWLSGELARVSGKCQKLNLPRPAI